jgi:hypothetical protein
VLSREHSQQVTQSSKIGYAKNSRALKKMLDKSPINAVDEVTKLLPSNRSVAVSALVTSQANSVAAPRAPLLSVSTENLVQLSEAPRAASAPKQLTVVEALIKLQTLYSPAGKEPQLALFIKERSSGRYSQLPPLVPERYQPRCPK